MVEHLDVEEILNLNPHIKREKLQQAHDILLHLRERKVRRAGYGLAPPFSRRRVSVKTHDDSDSRTVRLTHRR